MKKISVGLIGIAALGLLGACSSTNDAKVSNDKDGKLEIVTTFYPMYDFTK
ncbi:zinc ABC transporter substrate-binding protein, partial [Enterococcus faecium]|nr:zinc ABC transporter substrate-binding protein [Enterococcus faecium]